MQLKASNVLISDLFSTRTRCAICSFTSQQVKRVTTPVFSYVREFCHHVLELLMKGFASALSVGVVASGLFAGGCKDSGIEPSTSSPIQKYYLYVGNWGFDQVYVVDTDSNTVVDTLRGFGSVWDLATTVDGTKLYVCARMGGPNAPGSVYSVDIRRKVSKQIHPKVADVYVTPQGTVVIISRDPYQPMRPIGTIDPATDAITFFDTLDIRDTGHNDQGVVFSRNKPLLYGINNGGQLFAYDYDSKETKKIYNNLNENLRMALSPDGKLIFVSGGDIFDLERDSTVGFVGGNKLGSVTLNPSGEYLYVTDPGGYLIDPIPSGKVFIFDTKTKSYSGYVDVKKSSPISYQTDRIVLTPDGKTAYVSNWLDRIFVIDLQASEVTKMILVPAGSQPVPMVLCARP